LNAQGDSSLSHRIQASFRNGIAFTETDDGLVVTACGNLIRFHAG